MKARAYRVPTGKFSTATAATDTPEKKERVKPLSEVLMQTVAKFFASQQRKQPFSIRKAARVSAKRVREEIV